MVVIGSTNVVERTKQCPRHILRRVCLQWASLGVENGCTRSDFRIKSLPNNANYRKHSWWMCDTFLWHQMMAAEERMYPDKLKEVERLFCQMKLDGLEPEVPTYNSVIYGWVTVSLAKTLWHLCSPGGVHSLVANQCKVPLQKWYDMLHVFIMFLTGIFYYRERFLFLSTYCGFVIITWY